jgi:ferric-dicitrate binding protein FerR (iron transport regulator)
MQQVTPEKIADILLDILKGDATDEDKQVLDQWMKLDPKNNAFVEKVLKAEYVPEGIRELSHAQVRTGDILRQTGIRIEDADGITVFPEAAEDPGADIANPATSVTTADQETYVAPVHRVHFLKTSWFRYAAAVVLLVGGAAVGYKILKQDKGDGGKGIPVASAKDIAPGSEKAVLTLADGSTIILDNAANGNVAQQGGTKIIKLDNGQLAYDAGRNTHRRVLSGELLYNTISTPRGGQYQITLPDGTKVWLNAASSIKFPATFSGSTREVEMTGEAYMEIAKNSKQPFRVKANGTEIQVLGTSFNINAYSDEEAVKTTLIEGSVKVLKDGQTAILKPGQQSRSGSDDRSVKISVADLDKVMAWKNGLFNFEGAGLKEVMQQLSRWYDVEVVYESKIPDIEFIGKMSRKVSLSGVLKGLEGTGVHFRIENGRRLVVLP